MADPVPETPGSRVHFPELVEKGAKAYWESLGCRWAEADGYQRDKARAVSEAILSVVPAGGGPSREQIAAAVEAVLERRNLATARASINVPYWDRYRHETATEIADAVLALSASHPDDELVENQLRAERDKALAELDSLAEELERLRKHHDVACGEVGKYEAGVSKLEAEVASTREALERIRTRIPPPESNAEANRMWMIAREALGGG